MGRAPDEVTIREESGEDFQAYSDVPISFSSDRIFVPVHEDGSVRFHEQIQASFTKDYDSEPGQHPTLWPTRFDTSRWTVLSAWRGQVRVGGAVLVHDSPEIDMLRRRSDLALIWDLRVHPAARGVGIGSRLVEAAIDQARRQGCTELEVETQNINVAACRFYERTGFRVASLDPDAYPELPDEVQIIWSMDL